MCLFMKLYNFLFFYLQKYTDGTDFMLLFYFQTHHVENRRKRKLLV